jgi:alkylation response protein AidB-like acyl-CoA dehydrogenase
MTRELTARTEAGARLVAVAERLAADLARDAPAHDRDGSFRYAAVEALKDAGWFGAPVPVEHGGLGVLSLHDLLVASSRLARGDASVAIGLNMHLVALLNVVRRWQVAVAQGDERRAARFAAWMAGVTRDGVVMAAAISEHGQDLTRPSTVAVRSGDGWRLDGRKAFCTMSPGATHLYVAVTYTAADGEERYGYAQVPVDAPGVRIHDDWDALGMRASGSHTVSFREVALPASAVSGGFAAGDAVGYMERNLAAGLFHASASLGIAEAAHATALAALARRDLNGGDTRTFTLAAENEIDLSAARGGLARAALLIEERLGDDLTGDDETVIALFTEGQAAKTLVNEAAGRIVDRALTLSGGAGYLSSHPIARAYRDVRAGSFMHPLGSSRAYDFVGRVALGLEPSLH